MRYVALLACRTVLVITRNPAPHQSEYAGPCSNNRLLKSAYNLQESILVRRDDLATFEGDQAAERGDVDRVLEEADAAISHQDVDAARMEREELVVSARVIALGDAVGG